MRLSQIGVVSLLLLAGFLSATHAQQFSSDERAAIVQYWKAPGRFKSETPKGQDGKPIWQVCLTPEASLWLWKYQRAIGAGKLPPTQDASSVAVDKDSWEKWVAARVTFDRAQAQALVVANTGPVPGTVVATLPIIPAPPPEDLIKAVGAPPPQFARPKTPFNVTVVFDDPSVTLTYVQPVPMRPRYAYFRFDDGVMSVGTPLKDFAPVELDRIFGAAGFNASEQRIARSVSKLEGGFDSINTYDTGYVSVGFIQFACLQRGGGTLGELLLREKKDTPDNFQKDFRVYGIDVTPEGLLAAIHPDTGEETTGPAAALTIIHQPRLAAVFQRAGQVSEPFRLAQIRVAKSHYWPTDDMLEVTIDGVKQSCKVSEIIHSEAGIATLFDRKVNRGSIAPLQELLQKLVTDKGLKTVQEAAKFERELLVGLMYRVDFLLDKSLSQPE